MPPKIYLAVILSDYQELGLKRFINHLKIKEKIIIYKYSNDRIKNIKFSKNVKKKVFYNKYFFLIFFFFILLKLFFYKKKFIFGNPESRFCNFLSKFISGENITYLDDGTGTISFDFNKLNKGSTLYTIYNIKTPKKIKKIQYFIKLKKKRKKTLNNFLLIGAPFISRNICSKEKFIQIMKILSKFHNFYYYPHRFETDEIKLLPKNFKLLERKFSVEEFLYNYKHNFKLIYAFNSSSITEIIHFYKKESLIVIDAGNWFDNTIENIERKRRLKIHLNYLKRIQVKVLKLYANN
jgi:hypothetical protein